jgi:hypothetical protein
MKLWKYSGTFLTATGIIHTIYALFIGKDAFSEMLRNGLVNSIGENYSQGLVLDLRSNTYPFGANASILYQKRTKTSTRIFRLLYFTTYCNRLHY